MLHSILSPTFFQVSHHFLYFRITNWTKHYLGLYNYEVIFYLKNCFSCTIFVLFIYSLILYYYFF